MGGTDCDICKLRESGAALSERKLAERWDISMRTLQRWRAEMYGPGWLRIGGSIRYPFADILAYEAAVRSGREQ